MYNDNSSKKLGQYAQHHIAQVKDDNDIVNLGHRILSA